MESRRELPVVRQERQFTLHERAPPRTVFGYVPGRTSVDAIRRFLDLGAELPLPPEAALPLPLYFSANAIVDVVAQGEEDARKKRETMGFLAGSLYTWRGVRYGVVRDAVTGGLDADAVSVRFAEDRGALFSALDRLTYDYVLLGWYHSHPGYSCFLSPTDLETSTRMFSLPHHRAVVHDPIGHDLRSFQVVDGRAVDTAWAVFLPEASR